MGAEFIRRVLRRHVCPEVPLPHGRFLVPQRHQLVEFMCLFFSSTAIQPSVAMRTCESVDSVGEDQMSVAGENKQTGHALRHEGPCRPARTFGLTRAPVAPPWQKTHRRISMVVAYAPVVGAMGRRRGARSLWWVKTRHMGPCGDALGWRGSQWCWGMPVPLAGTEGGHGHAVSHSLLEQCHAPSLEASAVCRAVM